MRFGIGAKLGVLASVLIIGTSAVVVWWLNHWSRESLRRESRARLADQTLLRGEELRAGFDALSREAQQLAAHPEVQEFLRAPASQQAVRKQHVQDVLAQSLKRLPHLLQAEFLPAKAGGLPAVRAHRQGGAVRADVRNEDRLKQYFQSRLDNEQNAGAVRLAGSERNGDATINGKPVPADRAAVLLSVAGEPRPQLAGCLLLTADFTPLSRHLCRDARLLAYLANSSGRFIVHPEPERECLPDTRRHLRCGRYF